MPGAAQHAFLGGPKRKNMSGPSKIAWKRTGFCEREDRSGAVLSGDAGRSSLEVIDADGKWRSMPRGVDLDHHREIEFLRALFGERHTNNPTGPLEHERDHFRRHGFGRRNEIAFVLAVFVVDHDHALATADLF